MDLLFPFKVGGYAESRSSIEGYRGAWFVCKINGRRVTESGHFEYYVEYTAYPEEDKEWIRVFEKNPQSGDQMMLRPSFPEWYRKDKVPEQLPDNDVIAIVDEAWKVGDRIDWFCKGSHWSGRITKLLGKAKVKVELLQPPMGEGEHYEANVKNLRPTLDWSLERGWTVPLSQAKGKSWHAARVIHRKSAESDTSDSREEISSDDGDKGDNGGDGGVARMCSYT